MTLLRKINAVLGSATGFQVRRVPRGSGGQRAGSAPARAPGHPPARRPGQRASGYRRPAASGVDRLLRRPVFVIAPVRSGSTLLRMMLGSHSLLHAPHETHFRRLEVHCATGLAEKSLHALGLGRGDAEHLLWDRLLHRELVKSGKQVLVEKTPGNAFVHERVAACWPDARFVFLLRHPASVARSWHEADPVRRSPEHAVLDALRFMNAVERARGNLNGYTVRYEELTEDPALALKGVCAFLGVDWEPGMLDYGSHHSAEPEKGLGDWKEKIRTGSVQPGRPLPDPAEVPAPLHAVCAAWGYPAGPAGTGRGTP
ncbi:sulfotransferase family protein [Streptomyces marincola]|uniref:Sulfotransferase family protein n=1 Tax=Streptomyces marincola TaxID=2878388 RepID=A0A1W7D3B9_9ACTN|nr:sulfotransferase [Streptomyces marincola]ARQ71568.1 sulfotransferase family protein [Streptomyces marincola]